MPADKTQISPAGTNVERAATYFPQPAYSRSEFAAYSFRRSAYSVSNWRRYTPQSLDRQSRLEAFAALGFQLATANTLMWNRALATRLCEAHPDISTDPAIYGGNPHIKDIRLTVGNILAKVYIYGSTKAVADIYAPDITESQVKEAIAYAQDFLEEAIHPPEAP